MSDEHLFNSIIIFGKSQNECIIIGFQIQVIITNFTKYPALFRNHHH